ncbi:MAG: exonuclease SbcCD subunit D [Candidatus Daviesbacteria bacterium]|nr:MAG: exonuclease SbcCD subunit D [Candidatus Daviesbacteria bacterium]
MKLLHFSDIHIGMENYAKLDPETGLSSRLLDFFNTFDFIVDLAIKENVDAVVFAGDAYKTRDPNPTQQRGFGERIKKLAKAGIPTILVVGNHDTPNAEGKANTLDIYSALEIDHVWVSRKPEYLKIPTKSGTLQVITLPWLHKNDYKTVGDKLKSLYDKITSENSAIFLSHAEVEGSQYGSEKGMAIGTDVTIPLPLLQDKRLDYVALGHIHKHQVLSKPGDKPLVVYSGSPERIDFGEEKEEKGICLVEITSNEKRETTFKFIPTSARIFRTIKVSLKPDDPDPTRTVIAEIEKHKVKDAIARIIVDIPADLDKEIKMDLIKKALKEANFIAGISRNVERKERSASWRIDGQEEVERLTPIEALKKYFAAKKISLEKQKELEKYAAQLLES